MHTGWPPARGGVHKSHIALHIESPHHYSLHDRASAACTARWLHRRASQGATRPKALVFANNEADVVELCTQLQQAGAAADCLHGERDKQVRLARPPVNHRSFQP